MSPSRKIALNRDTEGTQLAHLDRSFRQPQHGGHVVGRQLFEVPQYQQLAVALGELEQGGLHAGRDLAPLEPAAGTAAPAEETLGQHGRRLVGQGRQRALLALDAAFAGADVVTMEIDEAVPRELTKPGVERHRPLLQVLI